MKCKSECFTTNLKCFWYFLSYFISVVSKNVLTLLQNLATVVIQRQSTLMAKLAVFSRLDEVLSES